MMKRYYSRRSILTPQTRKTKEHSSRWQGAHTQNKATLKPPFDPSPYTVTEIMATECLDKDMMALPESETKTT